MCSGGWTGGRAGGWVGGEGGGEGGRGAGRWGAAAARKPAGRMHGAAAPSTPPPLTLCARLYRPVLPLQVAENSVSMEEFEIVKSAMDNSGAAPALLVCLQRLPCFPPCLPCLLVCFEIVKSALDNSGAAHHLPAAPALPACLCACVWRGGRGLLLPPACMCREEAPAPSPASEHTHSHTTTLCRAPTSSCPPPAPHRPLLPPDGHGARRHRPGRGEAGQRLPRRGADVAGAQQGVGGACVWRGRGALFCAVHAATRSGLLRLLSGGPSPTPPNPPQPITPPFHPPLPPLQTSLTDAERKLQAAALERDQAREEAEMASALTIRERVVATAWVRTSRSQSELGVAHRRPSLQSLQQAYLDPSVNLLSTQLRRRLQERDRTIERLRAELEQARGTPTAESAG